MSPPVNLHATVVAISGQGILIRGAARSGKSSLALSLLRRAELLGREAALVSDDQVFIETAGGGVEAVAPPSIRGLIEISGIGIVETASIERVRLHLVVELAAPEAIERMPETRTAEIAGVAVWRITLPARQAALGADILHSLLWCAGGQRQNSIPG